MKPNNEIYEPFRTWFDPIMRLIKILTLFHSGANGNFNATLGISAFLTIADSAIALLVLGRLFWELMKKRLNGFTESSILKRFAKLRSKSLCPFARKAKLFASGIGKGQDIKKAVKSMLPRLVKFSETGKKRKLDGFIIELPAKRFASNLKELCKSFNCLLRELARNDPSGENCFEGGILQEHWQFSFNSTRFFVTAFAPFYDSQNPRYSRNKDCAFVFLQPEYSFDNHGISSRNSHREEMKRDIRKKFHEEGSGYDIALVKQPLEALKYIKPLSNSDPPVRWWRS